MNVVEAICEILEELASDKPEGFKLHQNLIAFVTDRPGHDKRYVTDASKIERKLCWVPQETFESGLRKTVLWYLTNTEWWQRVLSGKYRLGRIGGEESLYYTKALYWPGGLVIDCIRLPKVYRNS